MDKYEVIQIRVTPEEKSVIREMAAQNRENMSEFILRVIDEYKKRQPEMETKQEQPK